MFRRNNETGFTLIELILVIVILGILTAVALPKFIDLDQDARKARNQGALAAFRGTITMLHGKLLIQGDPTGDYSSTIVANNTEISGGTIPTPVDNTQIIVNWDDGSSHQFSYSDNGGTTTKGEIFCNAGGDCS